MGKNNSKNANNANIVKDYLLVIIIAVIGTTITVMVFLWLFLVSKESITHTWDAKTIVMSQDIEQYLSVPKDAIVFASSGVEELMDKGASNKEINDYLISGTNISKNIIESNNTGIYGYVNGEYLDSSGWTPPAGYDSKTRPWYIDAVKAGGEVTFVEPYINVQTDTLMMSVSKLLKDNESVLSMDIYLDTIQKLNEDMLENDELDMSLVIDSSGIVVASSDKDQIGKNFYDDENPTHKVIATNALQSTTNNFSFFDGPLKKTAFCKRINNEWSTVFVFTDRVLFKPVRIIYLHSFFVLLVVFLAFVFALKAFRKRHFEEGKLQNELAAIADIYLSLSILDLKELKLNKMWVSEKLTKILAGGNYSLTRVDEIVKAIATESSRNMLEQFMDFSTVAERLRNTKSISHDFLDIDNHWTRMHFIAGNRGKDGELQSVIWATESIDEDRRRQEEFRKKAETDVLTQILNRRGGETRIYEAIEKNTKGMFMILDADHFKSVNDTYGHDAGDAVIKSIADCLTETFRDTDVVFRLGGDEFAVYATGVDSEEIGNLVAGRLFDNINKVTLPGVSDWKLCVSAGATFCDPKDGLSFDEYFKQADTAMYESKQKEGNQISFYTAQA